MSITAYKTFLPGETLTAADLNASFDQILDNGIGVWSPAEGSVDFNGQVMILDADGDSSLTADTDDQLDLALGGADVLHIVASSGNVDLQPEGSNEVYINSVTTRNALATTATLQTVSNTTETNLTTLSAITLPRTDTVSSRLFRVQATIHAGSSGGAKDITFRLYNGANGTAADTLVEDWDISFGSGDEDTVHIDHTFTPGADSRTKVGFSVQNSAATASEFNNGHSSTVIVSELLV